MRPTYEEKQSSSYLEPEFSDLLVPGIHFRTACLALHGSIPQTRLQQVLVIRNVSDEYKHYLSKYKCWSANQDVPSLSTSQIKVIFIMTFY